MAYGIKQMRKIQIGVEGTMGTPVAATSVWRGEGLLDDNLELKIPKEDVGYLVEIGRMYTPFKAAAIKMNSVPATFEQLGYILNAGIHYVAGSKDGAGSGYIYQRDGLTGALTDIKAYTLRGGDNQRCDIAEYCFVQDFTLKGVSKDAVMVEANWVGRQATDGAYTNSIAVPAVEEILFSKGKLYVDDSGGTIGTTAKLTTWLGFDLKWVTGWIPRWSADGQLYFSYHAHVGANITGTMTYEHDTTGAAELVKARTRSIRLVRMLFESPTAFALAGTVYSYPTFKLDMAIQYTKVPPLSEMAGNDTIALPFRAVYSVADVLFAKTTLVNALTALT